MVNKKKTPTVREETTSPEVQMKLLSPFMWSKLSKDFVKETGVKLDLKSTDLTKRKYKNEIYQIAKFNFVCEEIVCTVEIEYSNKILRRITEHKAEFEEAINDAVEIMIEEYNDYKAEEKREVDDKEW